MQEVQDAKEKQVKHDHDVQEKWSTLCYKKVQLNHDHKSMLNVKESPTIKLAGKLQK